MFWFLIVLNISVTKFELMLDLRVVGGHPVPNQSLSSFILVYKLSDLSRCYRIESTSHI